MTTVRLPSGNGALPSDAPLGPQSDGAPASLPPLSAALVRARGLDVDPALLALPERVVQFGTGALLRGLADSLLDRANRAGRFGGRVVMVGSTGSGRAGALEKQDGLYTLAEQGLVHGEPVERTTVVASVSRALSAQSDWDAVLELAASPDLCLVVSNTTEIGIRMDEGDSVRTRPPRSFPAKLAAFLHARACALGYAPEAGLVVLPCELIDDNGAALRALVLEWAERDGLEEPFRAWVQDSCAFPNTLVDRIVPGAPEPALQRELEARLGYTDRLLTVAEPYRLWAVEGDAALGVRLGLEGVDDGLVVTPSVAPYRLRKVRLLNGTHTLLVPVALGCGCVTVEDAMRHPLVGRFVRRVMDEEIVPAVEAELGDKGVPPGTAARFAEDVRDRFANPFLRHELTSITLQQTMKVAVRVVPTALRHAALRGEAPPLMTFGFAAFLLLHRAAAGLLVPGLRAEGLLDDEHAGALRDRWRAFGERPDVDALALFARAACSDRALWDADLSEVPGFVARVAGHLRQGLEAGLPAALEDALASPVPA